ncbi:riboflavin synthase [Bacteroidia bacterium]|nr:riboflavin synthase [Bacteroidia bacterium]MDB9883124.1 riboflavin synthase [Bacteroidia bacterium]
MFSGIIETIATLTSVERKGTNVTFTFKSKFTSELKIDQSVAHNGVCLTLVEIVGDEYKVTAIEETLRLTNLGKLTIGDKVNFERCIRLNDRLDGHIVQGHVDGIAKVLTVADRDGSWEYEIELAADFTDINGHSPEKLIIHKGSITINGTSLTVTHIKNRKFGVAIIPYTYEHTNFHTLKVGDLVNIELDVLGKYVARLST